MAFFSPKSSNHFPPHSKSQSSPRDFEGCIQSGTFLTSSPNILPPQLPFKQLLSLPQCFVSFCCFVFSSSSPAMLLSQGYLTCCFCTLPIEESNSWPGSLYMWFFRMTIAITKAFPHRPGESCPPHIRLSAQPVHHSL